MRRWAVKRLIDICGASVGLVLLAPLLVGCALAVLCESRRHGVLFRQERMSRDGKPFTILKFRSLTPSSDAGVAGQVEHQHRPAAGTGRQAAAVQLARRAASADQRAARRHVAGRARGPNGRSSSRSSERPYAGYDDRHRVPAGITGWAQIHGLRGDTSIEERVRFDNHYIENWSLGLDVKIILRTVGSMLSIHRV